LKAALELSRSVEEEHRAAIEMLQQEIKGLSQDTSRSRSRDKAEVRACGCALM
jgi:hypothetical protein